MNQNKTRIKNTFRLIKAMKPYYTEMILTIMVTVLKYLAAIMSAGIAAYMTSLAINGTLNIYLNVLLGALCISIVIKALMFYGEMWFGHDVAYKVLKDFRIQLYDKIERIAPAYLLRNHSGNIGTSLMADVEALEWFLAHTFGAAISSFIISFAIIGVLYYIHLVIALITALFAVLISSTPFIFGQKSGKQGYAIREKIAQANTITIEGIHGLRDLLTLNCLERYKEHNRETMRKLYEAQKEYSRRQGTETMLMHILVGVFTVIIMTLAAYLVSTDRIDVIFYPVIVLLSAMLFSPIIEVCGAARNLGFIFAAADRIQTIFDTSPEVEERTAIAPQDIHGKVVFENVRFSYEKAHHEVLHGVSWTAEAGKITALTGHSGAGKSTCFNLLLRYWDTASGRIRIDDIDIRDIPLANIHDITCAVLQDVYLFNVSILENIRLGNPNVADIDVINAAKKAYADEFIVSLPDGYDTITGERGFRLSGGQRQRISIARAILKNAPVLLLDEAVSNLDTQSEQYIRKSLREHHIDKTIIIIAHRPSTIQLADKIIVMGNGSILK